MTEAIKELIVNVFGDNAWLGILIIAMIPLIELRGAIPFALGGAWAGKITWFQAYSSSVIGATIPAIVIIPLLIPVFNALKKTKVFKKLVEKLDEKFSRNSAKIENSVVDVNSERKKELKKFWGVLTFVALPIPLTGAWTGSAVAAYLKMGFGKGLLAVFLGNMISGAIMTTLCVLFPTAVDAILYAFLGLVVLVILIAIVTMFIKRKKQVPEAPVA